MTGILRRLRCALGLHPTRPTLFDARCDEYVIACACGHLDRVPATASARALWDPVTDWDDPVMSMSMCLHYPVRPARKDGVGRAAVAADIELATRARGGDRGE